MWRKGKKKKKLNFWVLSPLASSSLGGEEKKCPARKEREEKSRAARQPLPNMAVKKGGQSPGMKGEKGKKGGAELDLEAKEGEKLLLKR